MTAINPKYLVPTIMVLVVVGVSITYYVNYQSSNNAHTNQSPETIQTQKEDLEPVFDTKKTAFVSPLDQITKRVTKKKFGTYVTPQNSPVSPERFTGYHTAWDYEILSGEENKDISVAAFCNGKLVYKNYVNGYGGVAIQQCTIDGVKMTALYGHLRLNSIKANIGHQYSFGDKIGILGKGYSSETNGERKHLHFSLHRGSSINLRGYVSSKLQLIDWIDPAKYLG